ncbi:Na+/H+ antiporter subunit G [Hydrogenophaga sp. PBL-H3]|uniref:Na+/H+ antiporter subunit G n=1 Tax=Hydrogenophaga sp. PBL-H3 TaxID=434010 RepID=UPI0013203982|nr:Na+/H+ antiporter subunit G [Hydrogenophaga sp. PBL-H3]QHE75768.1 Na+/H+ antiporter subunit G [Hydrogenophaga sp. PBL-H3]QHE80193.1 Na+/H+ antiporter subunit G [Hydrogenophaga sp. PBL-H3]
MSGNLAWWIEIPVALLLVLSGLFALAAGVGVVRFKTFFQRMHPPALAYSFAAWCVTLASIVYFSAQDDKLALRSWLIIIFLALTVPVTTILLARTELFRRRTASGGSGEIPPPLNHASSAPGQTDGQR